jgi:hypothetical protein
MRLLLVLAVAWLWGSCRSRPPEPPADFEWTTWSNVAAGYVLEIPDVYAADVEDDGEGVFFCWGSTVPMKAYATDLESAKDRGLWVDEEPTGSLTLGGVPAVRLRLHPLRRPYLLRYRVVRRRAAR